MQKGSLALKLASGQEPFSGTNDPSASLHVGSQLFGLREKIIVAGRRGRHRLHGFALLVDVLTVRGRGSGAVAKRY